MEITKICGNVLRAVDEFQNKYNIDFNELKCKCGKCTGFGNNKFIEHRQNSRIAELYRKYEYPGVHRSLLWAYKALNFYLSNKEKDLKYSTKVIFSGYRCWEDNDSQSPKRKSTNHMGKAIDIHFNKNGTRTQRLEDMEEIRDKVIIPYTGAQLRWGDFDKFSLEPTRRSYEREFIATTWIHYDVRQFKLEYLDDKYFCTNTSSLNGKNIVLLATELGYSNMCSCGGNFTSQNTNNTNRKDKKVDPKTLKISQKGIDFIKDWEKFYSKPYNDSEGYATIGIGYLIAYKRHQNVTRAEVEKTEITWNEFQNGITRERATELFNKKIIKYEKAVQKDITVNLYQHEFDALVSLLFNTGENFLNVGGAKGGETKIKKNINQKKYSEGADEMADVTNGGTPGLVRRRKAEIKMFKNNVYDSRH